MELRQAVERFDAHLQAGGCSRHTRRACACDLTGLARFCKKRRLGLKAVECHHLAEFLNSPYAQFGPTGRQRAPGAINRVRASLRSFFRWLCDTGQIRANPAAALKSRPPRPRPPQVLRRDQERRLLQVLQGSEDPLALRDRAMVQTLLGTGVRVGELVGLNLADLDLEAQLATVRTKGSEVQMRHLKRHLAELLRRYLRRREGLSDGSSALFVSGTGERITARHFSRRLSQWLDRAGLQSHVSPHTFRHTLASRVCWPPRAT